jgi:hypothetical protein
MTFQLTEEQKQQIQAGFDKLDCKELRKGPYDSWAGIELQLAEAKTQTREDGTKFQNIFFMSRRDAETEEQKNDPYWKLNFSITKVISEDTDNQTWVPMPIKINKVVLEDNDEVSI